MRRTFPTPVFDANANGGKDLGNLPEWDLSDLYTAPDAPELHADMEWLETECAAFANDYEGKLASLDAAQMLRCIERDEKISQVAGRVMSYAYLRYDQATTDSERAKFLSDCQGQITDSSTALVFFSLEFNRIDDQKYEALFADEKLAPEQTAGAARHQAVGQ